MKYQTNLIFILVFSISLQSCFLKNNPQNAYVIERQFQLCFPKKDTWQNPSPTQLLTKNDVDRILNGAHILAGDSCISISEVQLTGSPQVFTWDENGKNIQVNGLVIQVSCRVNTAQVCGARKNAIDLVLPAASGFAYETQTFPKQLVELPTDMSSIELSHYWDLPKSWNFAMQLDVLEI